MSWWLAPGSMVNKMVNWEGTRLTCWAQAMGWVELVGNWNESHLSFSWRCCPEGPASPLLKNEGKKEVLLYSDG